MQLKFNNHSLSLVAMAILLSSCSGLVEGPRKAVSGDKERVPQDNKSKWVSRAQYEDLLEKYKATNKENQELKGIKSGEGPSILDEMNGGPDKVLETVDVFGKNGVIEKAGLPAQELAKAPGNFNDDLVLFEKAMKLKADGNADEALKVFQNLEKGSHPQLSVRVSLQIAEIYLEKKQFDLSLQVYETIITTKAYSGVALYALSGAAACAKALGLNEKSAQYISILTDVFGKS